MLRVVLPLTLLVAPFLLPAPTPAAAARALPPAAQDADEVEFRLQPLTPRLAVLFGSGGNIGIVHGDDGVLLVDDQFPTLTDAILEQVRTLSSEPVRFVVNTHWHGDHAGGNANLAEAGALIVGHENVRVRLSEDQHMPMFRTVSKAAPEIAWPKLTYAEAMSLHWNGGRIDLIHVAAAHTDSDSLVHFVDDNAIHMGDTFFLSAFPFIDVANGGSLDGVIAASERGLALCDENTRVIPGHGEVSDRAALEEYLNMLRSVREILAVFVDKGLTIAEILRINPLEEIGEVYGNGFIDTQTFTHLAASSLEHARRDR